MENSKAKYERLKRRKVTLSFSPDEYQKIVEETKKDGSFRNASYQRDEKKVKIQSPAPAVFLKKIVQSHLNNHPVIPETTNEQIINLRMEIRKIGNNINQIIKVIHTRKDKKTLFGNPVNLTQEFESSLHQIRELDAKLQDFLKSFSGDTR